MPEKRHHRYSGVSFIVCTRFALSRAFTGGTWCTNNKSETGAWCYNSSPQQHTTSLVSALGQWPPINGHVGPTEAATGWGAIHAGGRYLGAIWPPQNAYIMAQNETSPISFEQASRTDTFRASFLYLYCSIDVK